MRTLVFAILLITALETEVSAQCLPRSERDAFVSALHAALRSSPLSTAEAYDHAANRLGFGWTGDEGTRSKMRLAELIADRLSQVGRIADFRDERLAAIVHPSRAPDQPQHPFRHATRSMGEIVEEARFIVDLQRELAGMYGYEHPLVQQVRRIRGLTMRDIRNVTGARTMSHALSGPNVDIGTVLRELWFNHFNVDARVSQFTAVDYQRSLERAQCGTFRDLLTTSGQHPAMLTFLDNRRSRRGNINENYARELLELHTLGDDRFRYYDQADIVGVAKVLTGWTVRLKDETGAYDPGFAFKGFLHDESAVELFVRAPAGVPLSIPRAPRADGLARGDTLFRYLADHPATRRNICGKISAKLIGRASTDVVDACASDAVWGDGGHLPSIYRAILVRPEMWDGASYRARFKSPFELVASVHRALDAPGPFDFERLTEATAFTAKLGQPLGLLAFPTGYPEAPVEWMHPSTLVAYQQYLFTHAETGSVTLSLPTVGVMQTLSGGPLEREMRERTRDASDEVLDGYADDLKVSLGLPRVLAHDLRLVRRAFRQPDVRISSGATFPVRTATHALLTTNKFLRK